MRSLIRAKGLREAGTPPLHDVAWMAQGRGIPGCRGAGTVLRATAA
jgi:hypothetical protein